MNSTRQAANTSRSALYNSLLAVALLLVAALPAAGEMESALQHYLNNANLRGSKVSVCVVDVSDKVTLAAIQADRGMIPASNMKLVTTATALDVLGEDFKFSTKLKMLGVGDAPAADNLPALLIVGDGDPSFGSPTVLKAAGYNVDQLMGWWLDAVDDTGIDQFGQIIIDDRIFENGPEQRVHPSWPKNQLHYRYCAQVMGINFFENAFRIQATPTRRGQDARISMYPYGPFIATDKRVRTGSTNVWHIRTAADNNRMRFTGEVKNVQIRYIAIHDPAIVFGEMLKQGLAKRGITVREVVRPEGDQRLAEGTTLHQVNTTLQSVLDRTNQYSINLYAEALLKRCGHEITGAPGTFENGAAAVRSYLTKHFKDTTLAASVRVADGSGLSRDNNISARAMVELLRVQAVGKHFRPFLASLARPGQPGSLEKRLDDENKPLTGQVFAKTGTINFVCTLSGYIVYPDQDNDRAARILAFSILVNDHGKGAAKNISHARIRDVQDQLIRIMDKEAAPVTAE